MEKMHCDGCGLTEPKGLADTRRTIQPVILTITKDPRWPSGTEKFEADLCNNCRGMLLHNYFNIKAEGELELPAFIEPQSLSVRTKVG